MYIELQMPIQRLDLLLGLVAQPLIPATVPKAEAEGFQVQGQPGQLSESLSQNK